jgi:hypothetical protein
MNAMTSKSAKRLRTGSHQNMSEGVSDRTIVVHDQSGGVGLATVLWSYCGGCVLRRAA